MFSRTLQIIFVLFVACSCTTLPTNTDTPSAPAPGTPADAAAAKSQPKAHFWSRSTPAPAITQKIVSPDLPQNHASVATVDLTSQQPDLWARIRLGFGMQDLDNPNVERQLASFQAHPQAVARTLERGRKYLYHIVTELEKRGMPTELALLPLVESSFNPQAFSSAKAAGLWQFIPSTGRDFRLKQDWWVDERRDILVSTEAALTYLQAIYELQGDWHLALASYNWGENSVLRAVNNNRNAGKPTDFNSLRMPAETSQYVPKLQAIKMIVAHPEKYGITLPDIPNKPYFVTVERNQGIDLELAAKLAEMPLADFIALNPAYNRPVIPGSHDADLILPVRNAEKFRSNLAAHGGPLVSWKTYSLQRAERVEQVAQRLRLSVDTLRRANGLPPRARLAAGYTLLVPQSLDLSTVSEAPAPVVRTRTASKGKSSRNAASKSATARAKAKPGRTQSTASKATRSSKVKKTSGVAPKAKARRG